MPAIIKTTKQVTPQCYAYTLPDVPTHQGYTKIGFTERDVETRIHEQIGASHVRYKTWWYMKAAYMTEPYGTFTDKAFHAYLQKLGVQRRKGTEWFQIDPNAAKMDFVDFAQNHGEVDGSSSDATIPYTLRDEQNKAVESTAQYFSTHDKAEFLWNAKPRFGKTLSAYDLCKRMGFNKILIVTNRPAIANSWYQDYETFFGPQSGLLFVSSVDGIQDRKYVISYEECKKRISHDVNEEIKGFIEFVSLQDLKGSVYFGGKYDKLVECSDYKDPISGRDSGHLWDILIIDEAHEGVDTYKTDTAFQHIRRQYTLHLSGTPFKALANDKFRQEAIYNWTYADEQEKKRDWDNSNEAENPYATLPRLNLLTYQMSEIVRDKVRHGIQLADNEVEEYAFDLNEFFMTNESGRFIHDADIDKFLDSLTTGEKFPFSTPELRDELKHTFWLLNRVASARALYKKLKDHPVFKDYEVILAAGDGKIDDDDENIASFDRVREAIKTHDKTITLSVGQLTTGITIPEWTAVLMLSNMASPALYMQAAFRAQNPCLFTDGNGNSWRKQNAYVFDFDPARTLTIFEQFANDLIPDTAGEKGTIDDRKRHVRELLNFFPVYGEDDEGQMVELDAESVLTIPRHIHAKEVVDRGFMSNFLFANISNIFGAPKEVIEIINNMQALEEPKKLGEVGIDETTSGDLHLNENNEVEIPNEQIIGIEQDVFGDKVYSHVDTLLDEAVQKARGAFEQDPQRDELHALRETFSKPISDTLLSTAKEKYGSELQKSTQRQLERKIQDTTNTIVNQEYGNYTIQSNQLELDRQREVKKAQEQHVPMTEITRINDEYEQRQQQQHEDMIQRIQTRLHSQETIEEAGQEIVRTVETAKVNKEKSSIENDVRDHLRGFSRTIPAFLMAYGDESTTLANFDKIVSPEVFWEVTVNPNNGQGVTLEQFCFLRDGGDYYEKDDNGNEIRDDAHKRHFDGQLFDPVVFDDAVQEFVKRKHKLANYFDESNTEDIFDYIPPQRTNQIFTPKKVVQNMVDLLEKENPGCFDDPDHTFADLYMKSGMYVTEVVKRLYNSPRMKQLFPDEAERLNHIFAHQVYGLAPTEIIYQICRTYILGFSDEIHIDKDNIRKCDALKYAQNGTLDMKLRSIFPELGE